MDSGPAVKQASLIPSGVTWELAKAG